MLTWLLYLAIDTCPYPALVVEQPSGPTYCTTLPEASAEASVAAVDDFCAQFPGSWDPERWGWAWGDTNGEVCGIYWRCGQGSWAMGCP